MNDVTATAANGIVSMVLQKPPFPYNFRARSSNRIDIAMKRRKIDTEALVNLRHL
jgi:hypothetical protein